MKIVPALLLLVSLLSMSCKKEEPAPEPEPEQPVIQKGDLKIKVTTYDGLGDALNDHSGVKVTLQTGPTATTNAEGLVTFTGLNYGSYAPSLLKSGFDGPPVAIQLQSASDQHELPVAQHSAYQLTDLQCQIVSSLTINMYFKVNMSVPSGKGLKVAILAHNAPPTANSFSSVDLITVNTQTVNALNIAGLPDFKDHLKTLANGSVFYVTAIPVSYGLFSSNLTVKPNLLGESLYSYSNIQLIKNW